MLLNPYKIDFILGMIKEVKFHEAIFNWKLMKNIKVNNKPKNKDRKLNNVYPFGISSAGVSQMDYELNTKLFFLHTE